MSDIHNMTIEQFCDHFGACREDREWALTNCKTMAEVWDTAQYDWALWVATRPGVLTDRELRLFACWCARNTPCGDGKTTWDMMPHEDSRRAVIAAEKYANGEIGHNELSAAAMSAAESSWLAWSARSAAWAAAMSAEAAAWAAQLTQLRTIPNPFKGNT